MKTGNAGRLFAEQEAMRDIQVFAEWQAHYADRDYSIITGTWQQRIDRPLPIYVLRQGAGMRG